MCILLKGVPLLKFVLTVLIITFTSPLFAGDQDLNILLKDLESLIEKTLKEADSCSFKELKSRRLDIKKSAEYLRFLDGGKIAAKHWQLCVFAVVVTNRCRFLTEAFLQYFQGLKDLGSKEVEVQRFGALTNSLFYLLVAFELDQAAKEYLALAEKIQTTVIPDIDNRVKIAKQHIQKLRNQSSDRAKAVDEIVSGLETSLGRYKQAIQNFKGVSIQLMKEAQTFSQQSDFCSRLAFYRTHHQVISKFLLQESERAKRLVSRIHEISLMMKTRS